MKLFYAMGGGWGHLKRVATFARNMAYSDFKIITSNPLAIELFEPDQIIQIPLEFQQSSSLLASRLDELIVEFKPSQFIVDVFPAGILGELSLVKKLSSTEVCLLCRRMKWEAYADKADENLQFEIAYIFEPLEDLHDDFVNRTCITTVEYELQYETPKELGYKFDHRGEELWLVVHGFDCEEVETLCKYALERAASHGKEVRVLLSSDCDPKLLGVEKISGAPIDFMPHVDKIVSACGFNTMYETKAFRQKQIFMPFPRKYDDQFWRLNTTKSLNN